MICPGCMLTECARGNQAGDGAMVHWTYLLHQNWLVANPTTRFVPPNGWSALHMHAIADRMCKATRLVQDGALNLSFAPELACCQPSHQIHPTQRPKSCVNCHAAEKCHLDITNVWKKCNCWISKEVECDSIHITYELLPFKNIAKALYWSAAKILLINWNGWRISLDYHCTEDNWELLGTI